MTLRYAHVVPEELTKAAEQLGRRILGDTQPARSAIPGFNKPHLPMPLFNCSPNKTRFVLCLAIRQHTYDLYHESSRPTRSSEPLAKLSEVVGIKQNCVILFGNGPQRS